MIIYSVSVTVDNAVQENWESWMRNQHIQDVLDTGYFVDASLRKLLEPAPEAGTTTYNIQYRCKNHQDLLDYQTHEAARLQADHNHRYKDRFVAFRTILEEI